MQSDPKRISTNFSKGLNLSVSHMISPEELQQADNFIFSDGSASVRQGIAVNATLPYPVVAVKKHYRQNGSAYIMAFCGGQPYISVTSGVFANVSCETMSGDISIAAYDDYLYFTNYSNPVKLFDGSSVDNVGLSSPAFISYLGDFEDITAWEVTAGSATITEETAYLHVDRGEVGIRINAAASSYVTVLCNTLVNLGAFSSGVPSGDNDILQIFVSPTVKANITEMWLGFYSAGEPSLDPSALVEITNLSSWTYSSNDGWSMVHTIPKTVFTQTSGFTWGNGAAAFINVGAGAAGASVVVDNLRLVKTPPILGNLRVISGGGLYYSYANNLVNRYESTRDVVNGLVAPSEWDAMSSIDTGVMTYYKTTFVKRGPRVEIESNPSFLTSGVYLSGGITSGVGLRYVAQLTEIPVAPANLGVTARKIYRRTPYTPLRVVATIADNTTTSFVDDIPDEVLGNAIDETRWPPPRAKYIYTASTQQTYYVNLVEEDGRPHSSRVRYSQPYAPHYVPLGNVFDISPNDGSDLTGVFEYLNLVHFLKGGSTWMLDNGNLSQVHSTYGCVAPKSLAVGPSEVFWLSDEGIIKYSLRFKNISLEDARIEPFLRGLNKVTIQKAAGVYYKGFYLLAIASASSTVNDTILCYDNMKDVWSMFPNIQVNCWDVWSGAKDGYRLFYGNNAGQICEMFTGDTDFGSRIPWAVKVKDFGNPVPTTALRSSYLCVKRLDTSGHTITATPYLDSIAFEGKTEMFTSGPIKFDMVAADDAGFISVGFSGTGRIQLLHADLFGKEESLR